MFRSTSTQDELKKPLRTFFISYLKISILKYERWKPNIHGVDTFSVKTVIFNRFPHDLLTSQKSHRTLQDLHYQ